MAKKSMIERQQKKQKFEVRQRNRCQFCGRARGYMRRFGLCRLCFREKANLGQLPGVIKASW